MLELKLSTEEDGCRQAVIVFDEMAVRECFEYSKRSNRTFGNQKKVQVVMIRDKISKILFHITALIDCHFSLNFD